MRTIAVVTVARSDYGIYLPILRRIQADPDLKLALLVTGMHFAPEFGLTARQIEADGFEIAERVEMLLASDTPTGIGQSMGMGVMGFAQVFSRFRPDILVALGDRFETIAAPLAALPYKIPVAHLHGGEITEGTIDDALRHAITKLSHLHFVSSEAYARRVIQMGEEPQRVIISGAPSLDNLRVTPLLDARTLEQRYQVDLSRPPLLVTYHPVTLEYEQTEMQGRELLAALEASHLSVIFTLPNADTGGRILIDLIRQFAAEHSDAWIVENLGTQGYFSMMRQAAAMVGNSSSGIIEAASFKLPVVNIGTRQRGRVRAENVIDVGYQRADILNAIQRATSADFRAGLSDVVNPYGEGHAAEIIVNTLKQIELNDQLIIKHFHDL